LNELFDPSTGSRSLNRKNSAYQPQTVRDLPTKVGRSLRPDEFPKKFMMIVQRGYAKLSLNVVHKRPFAILSKWPFYGFIGLFTASS
jgi:hypothetical protein